MNKIDVSIGVCAYNEEKNIKQLLDSILRQNLETAAIKEIIVVCDGSTDNTEEVAQSFISSLPLRVFALKERMGKYAAINIFLKHATAPVLVLSSADIFLGQYAIEFLCAPFNASNIGMTACRPIPKNPQNTFLGYAVNLEWRLHHELSKIKPKFGELVAFRNIVREIPPTLVDEEKIAAIIRSRALDLKYVPQAIVFNKGPETIADFIKQRRRIYAGHIALAKDGYAVSTLSSIGVLKTIIKCGQIADLKHLHWLFATIFLEAVCRLFGTLDFIFKKTDCRWPIAETTKNLNTLL